MEDAMVNGQSVAQQQQEQQAAAQHAFETSLRELVVQVFNNEPGEQLLNKLDEMYLRQSGWHANGGKGYSDFRAGQNFLCIQLRAYLQAGKMAGASE